MTAALQKSKLVLSIQSHVAYGYVGNRAAVVALQALGHEAIAVHTVQLSNHTGYGDFKGDFFAQDHIERVLQGIKDRGLFEKIDAVVTGYLGDPALGSLVLDTVRDIRQVQGCHVPYICDPVMGDVGRGFFVKEALPPFFKDHAIHSANIITPNQFELSYLSDIDIKRRDDALRACDEIHQHGVEMILLTSLEVDDTPADEIQMLLSVKGGERYVVTTPKLHFDIPLNGSGDTTTALFAGYLLNGLRPQDALSHTASSIYHVFEKTKKLERRELALVQSQQSFMTPSQKFTIYQI
jgi:pyridoxine kinase